ncbi:hypothetical protein GRF59_22300 [Paenibacillus sp. HJL G12]|uniref:Epoxide hydrolase N-terminal domain-containing protein n=1 Tax=Paenibacillus dendrobii TaxID=2691084 RepID=A0A7X3LKC6_9BACL|nr:epoxide hydrolase N-terminal domain-containing protein [Paenibacillus dendrobii]MWV46339.1 hypothetical protein [Paenibacillus dendrobii]
MLDDLKYRLSRTRWVDALPEAEWKYGISLDYVKELAASFIGQFHLQMFAKTIIPFKQSESSPHLPANVELLNQREFINKTITLYKNRY